MILNQILTKIMNMMSQQFGRITERLDKLEANKHERLFDLGTDHLGSRQKPK